MTICGQQTHCHRTRTVPTVVTSPLPSKTRACSTEPPSFTPALGCQPSYKHDDKPITEPTRTITLPESMTFDLADVTRTPRQQGGNIHGGQCATHKQGPSLLEAR